jgi:chromosome segregation ATPase
MAYRPYILKGQYLPNVKLDCEYIADTSKNFTKGSPRLTSHIKNCCDEIFGYVREMQKDERIIKTLNDKFKALHSECEKLADELVKEEKSDDKTKYKKLEQIAKQKDREGAKILKQISGAKSRTNQKKTDIANSVKRLSNFKF